MHWDLETIEDYLIERPSDQKVASLLNQIKEKYIQERGESISLNQQEVAAYTMFYMPTNARKFNFLWGQLPEEIKNEIKELPFLDIGCGPGTYTWPAIAEGIKGPFFGIDSNTKMITQARRLAEGLFPDVEASFSTSEKGIDFDAPKTILFGNALNEMGVAMAMHQIERFNAQFVIFIEPGTSTVFDLMRKVRHEMNERKFEVLYPCASLEYECPIKTGDWCHQVLREVPDSSIERLGQIAKMDRKVQPYIAHVYKLDGKNHRKDKTARFVRFITESKHAFIWEVCLLKDGLQNIVEFEILKKTMDKKTQKEFKKLSIGHEVSYDLIKEMAENKFRVSVELLNGN